MTGILGCPPPSIGCDEYQYRAVLASGPLEVAIDASRTNVSGGAIVGLTGWITGSASGSVWDFGDGTVVSNSPFATHAWSASGDYAVVLRAYNASFPDGVSATVTVRVVVHCVRADSPNPTPPYTTWDTAARTIQEAVDAVDSVLEPEALVLVTNGVYASGGRVMDGAMTNRVVVDKPLTVRSVNGPGTTVIQGWQAPGTTNGDEAVRCVYLANGAVLSGFTLTQGATRAAGDTTLEMSGGGVWCVSASAVVTNCLIRGNSAPYGGGAFRGTLHNCILSGNRATRGAGAYDATHKNCMLTGNSAVAGGGVEGGDLYQCTLTGNSAQQGGGAFNGHLNNCILYHNTASEGANYYGSSLNHSCATPAPSSGTGNITADPQLAFDGHIGADSPCRGAGAEGSGWGVDIDGEPWLSPPSIGCDEYRAGAVTGDLAVTVSASPTNTPAGSPVDLTGAFSGRATRVVWDFGDGTVLSNRLLASHAWTMPGDYPVVFRAFNDSYPDGRSAMVMVRVSPPVSYVAADCTNPVRPYNSWRTAARTIQDAVDAAIPGSLVLVSNGVYATGGRAVYGLMTNRVAVDRPVEVRSVNGPEVTVIRGSKVLGTTVGDGAIRCVYLTNGAVLSGFTLTNGATRSAELWNQELCGGGVWCESVDALVTNCVITGNSAFDSGGGSYCGTFNHCAFIRNGAFYGGGAFNGVLNECTLRDNTGSTGGGAAYCVGRNCLLTGNWAGRGGGDFNGVLSNCAITGNSGQYGGGTYGGRLLNCTIAGNTALGFSGESVAGGAYYAVLNNCIVYYNTAIDGSNFSRSTLNYCCTEPSPGGGMGNITNEPLFAGFAAGNLRLQSNSPCINAGANAQAGGALDLDGHPRIAGGTVDMGAFEFQTPGSSISYAWLQEYHLATDGAADFADPDGDGLSNWQEWMCGTSPADGLSVLRLLAPASGAAGMDVTWQSAAGRVYSVERSTNLAARPAFWPLASGLQGQAETTTFTDTNAPVSGPVYYRVGVQP